MAAARRLVMGGFVLTGVSALTKPSFESYKQHVAKRLDRRQQNRWTKPAIDFVCYFGLVRYHDHTLFATIRCDDDRRRDKVAAVGALGLWFDVEEWPESDS